MIRDEEELLQYGDKRITVERMNAWNVVFDVTDN